MVLTKTQQEAFIHAIDAMPDTIAQFETLLKVDWKTLTFGEKLAKLEEFQEAGFAAGSLAGAARGARDLAREAQYASDQADTADQLRLAQERERDHLERLNAADAEILRLRTINSLRGNREDQS